MHIHVTCGLGLEPILAAECTELGYTDLHTGRGAVSLHGEWLDVYRMNWRLRVANRVLVELGSWPAGDGESLARGARALARKQADLLHPDRSLAIAATSSASTLGDTQWLALKTKDGLVDGQRERWGRRSHVLRHAPDLPLRLRLHRDQATLSLDTSGEPLDRRGYRVQTTLAPVREQLAAACILASGWDGQGPVVDPMCGSGTLVVEAGWFARGTAPQALRQRFAFEGFPGFDIEEYSRVRNEPIPVRGSGLLFGNDRHPEAAAAARRNLERAGLAGCARVAVGDAFAVVAPEPGPGLVAVNPPYGTRAEDAVSWSSLGDLLKQRFRGWRAVVLAGDLSGAKHIGLKPKRRLPVWNGPLEARILVFELY